jgi:hypothetical protein
MNPPQGPGNYGNYPNQGQGGYNPSGDGSQGYPPPAGGYPQQPTGGYPPPAGGYPQQPTGGYPPPAGGYGTQQYGYGQQQPGGYGNYPTPEPPKKSNTGLIVGIVGGLVVIAAALAVLFLVVLKKDDKPTVADSTTAAATVGKTTAAGVGTVTPGATTKAGVTTAAGTGATSVSGIPTYPGLRKVEVPQTFLDSLGGSLDSIPNAKVEAFASSDETIKLKDFYTTEFDKAGWKDVSAVAFAGQSGADTTIKQLEQVGAFIAIYLKNDTAAALIGFPGAIAAAAGVTGVKSTESLVIVISGSGSAFSQVGSITSKPATTKAATTAAATTKAATTAAATTKAGTGTTAGALSNYPGAEKIELSSTFKTSFSSFTDASVDLYVSSDSPDKIAEFFKKSMNDNGYGLNVSDSNSSSIRIITGVSAASAFAQVQIYDKSTGSFAAADPSKIGGKTVFLVLTYKV